MKVDEWEKGEQHMLPTLSCFCSLAGKKFFFSSSLLFFFFLHFHSFLSCLLLLFFFQQVPHKQDLKHLIPCLLNQPLRCLQSKNKQSSSIIMNGMQLHALPQYWHVKDEKIKSFMDFYCTNFLENVFLYYPTICTMNS